MELCDPQHDGPTHQHEPAPIPRDDTDEPLAAEAATGAEIKDTTLRLPAGTCKSNNPSLRSDPTAERYWHNWCDVNCLPSRWGAVGEGGCRDGSETGVVGCVCKQNVVPVKAAAVERAMNEASEKAEEEAAEAAAKVQREALEEEKRRQRYAAGEAQRRDAAEAKRQNVEIKKNQDRMDVVIADAKKMEAAEAAADGRRGAIQTGNGAAESNLNPLGGASWPSPTRKGWNGDHSEAWNQKQQGEDERRTAAEAAQEAWKAGEAEYEAKQAAFQTQHWTAIAIANEKRATARQRPV